MKSIRYDMLIAAVIILAASMAVYLIPVYTESSIAGTQFSPSLRNGWLTAGEIYLPAGDSLICSYSSDVPLIVGFAGAAEWVAFQNGSAASLKLMASAGGAYGTFRITAQQGESLFLVGNWSPSLDPVFSITVNAADAHGYAPYAQMLSAAGAIVLCASLTYEPIKVRFRKRI